MESSAHPLHCGLAVLCRCATLPEGERRLPPLGCKLLHQPPGPPPPAPSSFTLPHTLVIGTDLRILNKLPLPAFQLGPFPLLGKPSPSCRPPTHAWTCFS